MTEWKLADGIFIWPDGSPVSGLVPARMSQPVRHLVGAAPTMLAALEELLPELYDRAHTSGDPDDPKNMNSEAVDYRVCKSAIAKAKGQ